MLEKLRSFKEIMTRFLREKKGYVAIVSGLLVVGVMGGLLLWPKEAKAPEPDPSYGPVSGSDDETLNEVISKTPEVTPLPTPIPDFTPAPQASPKAGVKASKEPAPISGKVVWDFAVDELIYSSTLDQWMTHEGIDIACKLGSDVHAFRAGKVKKVYDDDRMGTTVVIEHAQGFVSLYANLNKQVNVKEGDRVVQGQVIGQTGDTAVVECGLEPHLHFEILKDDKHVNPLEYVLLEP